MIPHNFVREEKEGHVASTPHATTTVPSTPAGGEHHEHHDAPPGYHESVAALSSSIAGHHAPPGGLAHATTAPTSTSDAVRPLTEPPVYH
jgi:hypothetical protein